MKKTITLLTISISLALFAEEGSYVPKENLRYIQEARELLHSGEIEEVLKGIDLLTYHKSNLAMRDLLDTMQGDIRFPRSSHNDPVIKFYAAKALGKKGEPSAIPDLIAEFKKAAEPIGEFTKTKRKLSGNVAGADSVTSPYFYYSDEISIVLAAGEMLRALGDIGLSPESEETVKQALAHKNPYIRSSAADAIYSNGKKELLPSLRDALNIEKDDLAKIGILSAIGGLEKSPNATFYSLVDYLKKDNPEFRKKASEGLVRMDLLLAVPFYQKAISIENDEILLATLKEDYRKITAFKHP